MTVGTPRMWAWLGVVSLLAISTCDPGGRTPQAAVGFFSRESPAYLRVHDTEAVCDTCLELSHLRILGDTAGPGSVFAPFWTVLKDDAENYWVSQRGAVKVFSEDGQFIRSVGRLGQGPSEFGTQPAPFHADPLGRVYIYDYENLRLTVVDRDYDLVKEVPLRQPVFELAGLPGTSHYVANALVDSPELIGLPLHVMQDDSILASFGATAEDVGSRTPNDIRLEIAVGPHQRIVVARDFQYVIDFWLPSGGYLGRVEGSQLNDDPNGHSQLRRKIIALNLDADDHLWVVTQRPRADWSEFMQVEGGTGRLIMRPDAAVTPLELYTYRIDVLDLTTGFVIARLEREPGQGAFLSFVGSDEIAGIEPTPEGDLRLGIWTLTLTKD